MLEPEQGQRCRVEYREDQAQRALTDHKAADRVVDLASKSPDGIALRRRYPVIDSRHHLLPIIDEIAGNDRGHHQEREGRDQRPASGPNRTQKIAEPGIVVEPRGLDVRVRSVQVHDESVERAVAGQRVALSLPGVERTDLARGDVVIAPGAYPVSYRLDVLLDELEQISDGADLQVHHGTAEIAARVVRIGPRHAQLRLAKPVVAARGDHVVLRRETTVGGGRVLDPQAPRASDPVWLDTLERGDPGEIIRGYLSEPKTRDEISHSGLLDPRDLDAAAAGLVEAGGFFATPEWLEQKRSAAQVLLAERAARSPLDPGVAEAALLPPRAAAFLSLLGVERRDGKAYLPGSRPELGEKAGAGEQLESELAEAGVRGVKVDDDELGRFLEAEGRLVRLGGGHAVAPAHYARARDTLIAECEREGHITLARFRDLLGISRRPAQLLLERFDTDGITRRVGDERILRRSTLPS